MGDLPIGVHASTFVEPAAAFGCTSRERQILFERIARIHRVAAATRHLARFVVFGSFVSEKPVPNTVEFWQTKRDGSRRGIVEIVETSE